MNKYDEEITMPDPRYAAAPPTVDLSNEIRKGSPQRQPAIPSVKPGTEVPFGEQYELLTRRKPRMPKCPKTVSGRHAWRDAATTPPEQWRLTLTMDAGDYFCANCGLIDDTRTEGDAM
jgi:hypothetical protein